LFVAGFVVCIGMFYKFKEDLVFGASKVIYNAKQIVWYIISTNYFAFTKRVVLLEK
jgi:hypothetical protein